MWAHEWRSVGEIEVGQHRPDRYVVYEIERDAGAVRFAMTETSPGGYTFYVPVRREEPG